MNKLMVLFSVIKARGLRYFIYRSYYELKRKFGLLKYDYPPIYKNVSKPSLETFRNTDYFFFNSREELSVPIKRSESLEKEYNGILNGDIVFFSNLKYHLGTDYNWITNPDSGYVYDITKHWTEVEDIDELAGDIKFVWEKSRFSYIYTILRYDYHFGKDSSKWVFNEICYWIDKNPLNFGPNYKCSQEISIRILNWLFVLNFYKNSIFLTDDIFNKIINSIYGQIRHIENNINFSRICVRNNHAITETLTLYLTSLLLPDLPGAVKRKIKGKKYFEKEILYQIADDGTFIQESMNYHRVVIQLLTWAIAISSKNGDKFSDEIYKKAYKSLNFLYQCQNITDGRLSNYGANDGALFFPLNNNNYRDYRPQLDALHFLLTGKSLYSDDLEDRFYYSSSLNSSFLFKPLNLEYGSITFENSGYYLYRANDLLLFFRCGSYNGLGGGTNDQMHLDLWYKGNNILCDAGSYKYNTEIDFIKYFSGTESHNCIMLGNNHLMKKGIRFIWNNPPEKINTNISEEEGIFKIDSSIKCFSYIRPGIIWRRIITLNLIDRTIVVNDNVYNKPDDLNLRQIWHTSNVSAIIFSSKLKENILSGKCSDYYGSYRENTQIEFQTVDSNILTTLKY